MATRFQMNFNNNINIIISAIGKLLISILMSDDDETLTNLYKMMHIISILYVNFHTNSLRFHHDRSMSMPNCNYKQTTEINNQECSTVSKK